MRPIDTVAFVVTNPEGGWYVAEPVHWGRTRWLHKARLFPTGWEADQYIEQLRPSAKKGLVVCPVEIFRGGSSISPPDRSKSGPVSKSPVKRQDSPELQAAMDRLLKPKAPPSPPPEPRHKDRPLLTGQPTGESCSNCGSFALLRSGTCHTCQVCGETTGCG